MLEPLLNIESCCSAWTICGNSAAVNTKIDNNIAAEKIAANIREAAP
jgi:hypothetical protein